MLKTSLLQPLKIRAMTLCVCTHISLQADRQVLSPVILITKKNLHSPPLSRILSQDLSILKFKENI